ncbi:hypothetical protein L0Y65_02855 [Candidatus Micrarchaeota archaeon]|nr:hypothetical protein [Candidatus Micrarchaeota archaeon]
MANEQEPGNSAEGAEKNVKCSFCGNDTFCEQCKAEPAKVASFEHMCYECHQRMGGVVPENVKDKTHICIPPEKLQENFERFMSEMTYRAFSELWEAEKKKLKEMSRQELAQAAFFEGASFMWHFVQRMQQPPAQPPASGSQQPAAGGPQPEKK